MSKLNLTEDEEKILLTIIERYYPNLRREVANTDDREFRRSLKLQENLMHDIMERLKK